MTDKLSYKLTVRVFGEDGHKCVGPGLAELLRRVQRTKSLRSAAQEMGMAYSKAWRIVKDAESGIGFQLLIRQTGGRNGGGAELTKDALELLDSYDEFMKELRCKADELFLLFFGKEK